MATPAQIEANRQNALLSTGPTSPPGKETSRGNSRTHGLSGGTILVETAHPGFADRLAAWAAEIPVRTPEQVRAAAETAVAMTFRLEACDSAYWSAIGRHRDRARLSWDGDRWDEAVAELAALARRPALASARLGRTAQGTTA